MIEKGTYFVTGATGFIGTWLVKALLDRGRRVRALARSGRLLLPPGIECSRDNWLDSDRLEIVQGDVTDREAIRHAAEGCTHIFHLAALAKNWSPDQDNFRQINIEGTRNVLDAAREQGAARVVCTSTFLTLGPSRDGQLRDEETPRADDHYFNEYEETKAEAEGLMRQYASDGVPVVIVLPTRVYGPGHLNESNALAILLDDYLNGRMPFLVNRGVNVANYVYVDDVIEGHLLAMDKGRVGERYILGGENVSLRELADLADAISGKRHFRLPILKFGPMVFAHFHKLRAQLFGVYPKITPGWMRSFMVDWAYDCEKARSELGYNPRPLEDGLRSMYDWLKRVLHEKKKVA